MLRIFHIALFMIFSYTLSISAQNSAFNQLKYYEIIDLFPETRNKREILGIKVVKIKTLEREYTLHLKQVESILTSDFHVSTVDADGHIRNYYNFNEPQPYEGFVAGDPNSSVTAYIDGRHSFTAIIDTNNDTIMIEKLSRYDENEPVHSSKMVVYKQSHLKVDSLNNKSYTCGVSYRSAMIHDKHYYENKELSPNSNPVRVKRETEHKQTNCELLLVADYKFHKKYGKGNSILTTKYLIELIGRINRIYRQTNFRTMENAELKDYGFSIKHILIHEEPTTTDYKYNYKKEGVNAWDMDDLLKEFSRQDYSKYCLAHLFTYQQFSDGILGYAHIASPLYENLGGICSKGEYLDNNLYYFNTAFTTFQDGAGNSVLTLMAHLSTAHELGHNWGAHHDPDNEECSPGSQSSGKYIMYSLKVTGYEPNNIVFSPCTRRSVGAVLNSRAFHCFSVASKSEIFCGNQRKDPGEECDAGREGDACCTVDCHLRDNATCSKFNALCCTNKCQLAPRNTICAYKEPDNPCVGEAKCNGDLSVCPPPIRYDFADCAEWGTCLEGKCIPFCEYNGMKSCICDNMQESCLICCKSRKNSACMPTEKLGLNRLRLNDGRPCTIGVCEGGICQKRVHKLYQRLWLIIKPVNSNSFADFLRDNIVGTVIVLSLLVWIPICYLMNWSDKQLRTSMNDETKEMDNEYKQPIKLKKMKKPVYQTTFYPTRLETYV